MKENTPRKTFPVLREGDMRAGVSVQSDDVRVVSGICDVCRWKRIAEYLANRDAGADSYLRMTPAEYLEWVWQRIKGASGAHPGASGNGGTEA